MFKGSVLSIYISHVSGSPMIQVNEVKAVTGKGLEGDRFFDKGDLCEVTLIEIEALEALKRDYNIELHASETRRNILTEGVPLYHLVDKEFKVGEVTLKGVKLSEPCSYLEKRTENGVFKGLIHRGGLAARILAGGVIYKGDSVEG